MKAAECVLNIVVDQKKVAPESITEGRWHRTSATQSAREHTRNELL